MTNEPIRIRLAGEDDMRMTLGSTAHLFLLWALAAGGAAGQEHAHGTSHHGSEHARAAAQAVPLLEGMGTWHRKIDTDSRAAQAYFDQGLSLAYAFNHGEALRSFEEAVKRDPECGMCWWGIAYVLGPNINWPMEDVEERARESARLAAELTTNETETALARAMRIRYGSTGDRRAGLDSAYAREMGILAGARPGDADIQTLYAEALLLLRPWDQWTPEGDPQPGTLEVVRTLEPVVQAAPEHAGACHYYIHTVEASLEPERALECADRLPDLMPGAGHIVHMPAHVYLRTGRYHDAAEQNIRAVAADLEYLGGEEARGAYKALYRPHNYHFLWSARLFAGESELALQAARDLNEVVTVAYAREMPFTEAFVPVVHQTLARFGRWEELLAEPGPPEDLVYARGIWHFTRVLAYAGLGHMAEARVEADALIRYAEDASPDHIIILNAAPDLLRLASELAEGALAVAHGDDDRAVERFRSAVALQDELTYDEPPPWYHSARIFLGEALLSAGSDAEAEAVFARDLKDFPANGWALAGLAEALSRQGRSAEALAADAALAAAWRWADVPEPDFSLSARTAGR
jgi:tetratricopeptide (TPR) repeat protein